jgi:hypothetical protein
MRPFPAALPSGDSTVHPRRGPEPYEGCDPSIRGGPNELLGARHSGLSSAGQYGPLRAPRWRSLDERERTEARSVCARAQTFRLVVSRRTERSHGAAQVRTASGFRSASGVFPDTPRLLQTLRWAANTPIKRHTNVWRRRPRYGAPDSKHFPAHVRLAPHAPLRGARLQTPQVAHEAHSCRSALAADERATRGAKRAVAPHFGASDRPRRDDRLPAVRIAWSIATYGVGIGLNCAPLISPCGRTHSGLRMNAAASVRERTCNFIKMLLT